MVIQDKSEKEIKSVLEFPVTSEDHGAVYKCRAFAEATMSVPQESVLKVTFNVTCKLIYFLFTRVHIGNEDQLINFK